MWGTYPGAGAVVVRDGAVLLVRQRRDYGTFWEVPAGFVEAGESFEQAAAREVLEEAGVAVEVGELVCTLVWEREHDRRRNVNLYFAATPADAASEPVPQTEEDIDAARFVDLRELDAIDVHPLERPILDRLDERGFVLRAAVSVAADGSRTYEFHP